MKEVNREGLAKKLARGWFSLDELRCKYADIQALRDSGIRINQRRSHRRGLVFSVPTEAENTSVILSNSCKNATKFKWLELSDLHAGSMQFDEDGLRQILARAVKDSYKQVHVSGDLVDGIGIYAGHTNNLRYWRSEDQAQLLIDIFKDFPLQYIATHGNHCFSWDMRGAVNPLVLVEEEVPNFTYLRGFAADLIIGGVAKRMVHGASGRAYAKSYPGQTYVRDLLDSQGEHTYVHGHKYRLRFIQVGHYHSYLTYESAGIWISHSGNFQFPNDYTIRRGLVGSQGGRFVDVVIHEGKVLEYISNFVKPKR